MGGLLQQLEPDLRPSNPLDDDPALSSAATRLQLDQDFQAAQGLPFVPSSGNPIHAQLETDFRLAEQEAREPQGFFGGLLDLLSRGQFASAKFFDTLVDSNFTDIAGAASGFVEEALHPKERLSFSDVIKRHAPNFAAQSPVATGVLGLIGDIALDPTTYITFGAGAGVKVTVAGGKKTLTKLGSRTLTELVAKNGREQALKEISLLSEAGHNIFVGDRIRHLPGVQRLLSLAEDLKQTRPVQALLASKLARGTRAVGRAVAETFNRNFGLPAEFIQRRDEYLAEAARIPGEVLEEAKAIFAGLDEKSLKKIGEAGHEIDSETRKLRKAMGLDPKKGENLTPAQLEQVTNRVRDRLELSQKEFTALSRSMDQFQRMAQLEVEGGLLKSVLQNYFPRVYDLVDDPGDFLKALEEGRARVDALFPFAKSRKLQSLDEAKELGLIPELNAAKLYAVRLMASRRALAKKGLKDYVKDMLKAPGLSAAERRLIKKDVRFIGEGDIPGWIESPASKLALGAYDWLNNRVFRPFATVLRPSFAERNFVSSLTQSYLVSGVRASGIFNPLSHFEAIRLVKALDRPAEVADLVIRSPLGHVYQGEELIELMKRFRIVQGRAGDVLFRNKALKQLANLQAFGPDGKAANGLKGLVTNSLKFWRWPQHLEDHARTSLFINSLRVGHAPQEAAAITNKALYDYAEGLAVAERRINRRIFPFYTFTRFALPMLASTAIRTPGRIANAKKVFFTAINKFGTDEELTPAERAVLPGWLLEQANGFQGFTPDGKARFFAFNNFTPLDILSTTETLPNGQIDYKRTVEKVILASLAPVIKLPIEAVANRNFFTDRVIQDTQIAKGIGRTRVNSISNYLDQVLPESIKRQVGWERYTDPRTGEERIFINPFLVHAGSGLVPGIRDWFKAVTAADVLGRRAVGAEENFELEPWEAALHFVGGVSTYNLDLKEQMRFKLLARKFEISEQKRLLRRAAREGKGGTFSQVQEDLKRILQDLRSERQVLRSSPIRGPGLIQ